MKYKHSTPTIDEVGDFLRRIDERKESIGQYLMLVNLLSKTGVRAQRIIDTLILLRINDKKVKANDEKTWEKV